jgi:hypothetical protein
MAVGSIVKVSVSVYSTYVNVQFAKPANTTKFVVQTTGASGFYLAPQLNTFTSSAATGTVLTYKIIGLVPGNKYYLSVTPYNGSQIGTPRPYYNSTTNNTFTTTKTTTSSTSSTTYNSYLPILGASSTGPVSTSSKTGTTANGGTSSKSSAAPSNTPNPLSPGSVEGTPPYDLNAAGRITEKKEKLDPNTPYSIDVRAVSTDANGKPIYSAWSTKLNIITPGYASDGKNFQSINSNTDILLTGGSLYAGEFNESTGSVNVVTDEIVGTGIILNQSGLAGINNGEKQFYIDSSTGDAYFAGTVAATIIQSTSYSGVTDGTAFSSNGMAINLNNGSITSEQFRIDTQGNAYFGGDVSGSLYGVQTLGNYISATAQASASGKNTVYYRIGTTATSSRAPDGNTYYITEGSGTTGPSSGFPAGPITGQIAIDGDTWFAYNVNKRVIAQYTYSASSGGWIQTKVDGLVIANIDAGAITSGTISASIEIRSPNIVGGLIIGGKFQTSNNSGRIEIGNTNYQDTIVFRNYTGSTGATLSPFFDDSGVNGLIIHSGSSPTTNTQGATDGVAMTWVGRDYWTVQYKNNLALLDIQFNTLRTRNHYGEAKTNNSSSPSYGPSDVRMRNIGYGNTGTTSPANDTTSVGNGDIYLGY